MLAHRPTFKCPLDATYYGRCKAIFSVVEYAVCLPFKLDFQGVWVDHPDTTRPGWFLIYNPLYNNYSGISSLPC